jgi:hypothetical protein
MQESRRKETEAELEKRKSDATSKDTLEDLEETRKLTGGLDSRKQSIPSPDGLTEERSESADGSDTGGPM